MSCELPLSAIAFSPDGTRLSYGSHTGTRIDICDLSTGEMDSPPRVIDSGNTHKAFVLSPDGTLASVLTSDGILTLDTASGAIIVKVSDFHTRSILFSPNNAHIMCLLEDGTISVMDLTSGTVLATLQRTGSVLSTTLFPLDNTRLAILQDGQISVWNMSSGNVSDSITVFKNQPSSVVLSPDGARLASISFDPVLRLWDVTTGACMGEWKGHTRGIIAVAFSPDGARLATASLDQTVRIWDVASGTSTVAVGHTGAVCSVTFTTDGKWLASGSSDRTVRIWETESAMLVSTLEGHGAEVTTVKFSLDGAWLATASEDKKMRIWKRSPLARAPSEGDTT